ncbi:MAG: thioesterase superfamily protein [Myxococcales bacterium]|nr:thioesterase superfamily protein [Myxococcales bacterium]
MPVLPKEFLGLVQELIPFNKFLGIDIEEAREGWVRLGLPYRPEYLGDASRPALHGGVISTLIDTCGGFAVWTTISMEDRVSTIDLRVDYIAPGAPEKLVADGTVVRVGNRVGVVDVRVFQPSAPDRTVATGKAVYNIKRKEDSP